MSSTRIAAIATIRDGVCAVLRSVPTNVAGKFQGGIVGTAWCIATNRFFATAYHVFNNGQPRQPGDKFYLLFVPQNGTVLHHIAVTGFPFEDQQRDIAIIEAPPGANATYQFQAIPIAAAAPPDGTDVITYGCPSPAINAINATPQGDVLAVNTVLFTHGSAGIVAAQYPANAQGDIMFEFDIAWHHGESGGPVVRLDPSVAAISLMQHYRTIQAPHGTMAGPRRGISVNAMKAALQQAGATFT